MPDSLFACVWLSEEPGTGGRDPARFAALAQLARDFSPRIEHHAETAVVMDVSGLGRLLGDATDIGSQLRRTAADRGLRVRVAVSGARVAALLLAHARAGLTVAPPGTEVAALAPIPLRALKVFQPPDPHEPTSPVAGSRPVGRRTALARGSARHYRMAPGPRPDMAVLPPADTRGSLIDHLHTLHRWGLKTLGDLAALAPAALYERLGEDGLRLQQLARGEDTRPMVPAVAEEPFEASLDLEWPIEGLEPLSFVIGRVLDPLCARLARRQSGAAVLHVRLRLVTRADHTRTLELPTPFADPRTLRTLILLDLESHPPPAPIDRVTVTIDPAPGPVVQHSLLERAQPSVEQLSTLLARLTGLLGDGRSGMAALVDSHEPDAFQMRDFTLVHDPASGTPSGTPSPAPRAMLRRFRPPVSATVQMEHGHPAHVAPVLRGLTSGRVAAWAGPWRTSGRWWIAPKLGAGRTSAHGWNRDEWDVGLTEGTLYRVYRDRATEEWYVDGVID